MRKICVVITARPSYSRVRSLLFALKAHPNLELQVVVMASALIERYGNASKVIENDGFEIALKLFTVLEGESQVSAAKTTGMGILELSSAFLQLKPDIVVTIADRFETLATAVCASYMNIPLAHIQGGEVTGNIDEKVRHSVTKLADYHFVSSEDSMERVIRLGENPDSVFLTGCPSIDLAVNIGGIDNSLFEKYGGVGEHFDLGKDYIVVMQHPVTTEYGNAHFQILQTIEAIARLGLPTLWFWPNVDAGSDETSRGIRRAREKGLLKNVHFFKNIEPQDFLKLLNSSKCLVGNSSVGIRECAFMGVPVVNIGSRQNKRERGLNVIDVNYDSDEIFKAVLFQFNGGKKEQCFIYGHGNAGIKITNLLASVALKYDKTITY